MRARIGGAAVSAALALDVHPRRPAADAPDPDGARAARGPQNANTAAAAAVALAPPRAEVCDLLDTSSQVGNVAQRRPENARIGGVEKTGAQDPAERLRTRADGLARARPLARALAGLPTTPLAREYRRTLRCGAVLLEHPDGTMEGRRCNLRWCHACARVRTAVMFDRYAEALRALEDPRLLTLTAPNVPAAELAGEVAAVLERARLIRRALRKRAGGRTPVHALRKIECTHNADRGDFHPHLHYYVQGRDVARALIDGWLERTAGATRAAQDERPATDPAEVLKYLVKLPAPVAGGVPADAAAALNQIFRALRGRRVAQPLGRLYGLTPVEPADDPLRAPDPSGLALVWEYTDAAVNWIERITGDRLAPDRPDTPDGDTRAQGEP